MGMLPRIKEGNFKDGVVISAMPNCKEKYNKESCKTFYDKLKESEDGYYMCPAGYTVVKSTKNNEVHFYSGLRVKGFYNKKKKTVEGSENCSIITRDFLERLILADDETKNLQVELETEKEIHKDLLHDIRKLDGLIKNKSEEIIAKYLGEDNLRDIVQRVRNIHAMEELIACKYSVYDLVKNISVLNIGNSSNVIVYKKFDKVRYILLNYRNKGVAINFEGESDFMFKAHLVYFDILPFLLLENAVKYSPENREVKVKFLEINNTLKVSVDSYGPYCDEKEVALLFEKNYRGRLAQKISSEGTGIGLYLVKQICDQYKIELQIETEPIKIHNGIQYGYFTVNMVFHK